MTTFSGRQMLSTASTVVLVGCAIIVTALLIRREFFPPSPDTVETSYYEDWRELTETGHLLGHENAPVQIVLFFDYQCPFCRAVQPTIDRLLTEYPGRLAIIRRHFILGSIHPQARTAALAAECAADQGQFDAMHRLLFASASSLGQTPWAELAKGASVPDIDAFAECLRDERHMDRILADQTAVALLGVRSIPALVVNGTVVTGARPFEVLDELVREALARAQ